MAVRSGFRGSGGNTTVDEKARKDLVESLLPVVRAAGAAILAHRRTPLPFRFKNDASPVTVADLESEAIIRRTCAGLFPAIRLVSEEDASSYEAGIPSTCLLVDPLDGTKEFISGREDFTVNIALIENGAPSAGIIFAPALDRMFFTSGSGKLVVMDHEDTREILGGVVADQRAQPLILTSRSHLDPHTAEVVKHLQSTNVRQVGSSLKFALIAAGEADLYLRLAPTMVWDSAAGQALIEAAGGVVLRPDGIRLPYLAEMKNEGFVAACTISLAERVLMLIRSLRNTGPPD
ncbi:3'(2'),5'-bisphosphate nucleotidase CysQ [Sinorhizobium fredii]|uniref:3'(2'),5'-bisphosphate nucleotidase CysQ n=2 Tax=Rhizobium fredii TaxID=380 RepID=I3XG46_SINF2|nr:3'(2'),5'-bisphosphate nucleotidase CysQ [Sinorhizobium fredii]AFL54852.1 3'(2'),5'-bisphosphate nucleotidase CysQ [Sinorhizobium fredii USDA 257]MQX08055.1 3'(2'),5'-bisphosphate nucleotidase CysQ [Sinorhizobium fredii]CCE99136.1 hypothetical protein SFHH103_04663 [Sinorhizobium fredii HH103]CEO91822.1 putative 3'-Phosphoadenosine-5'-phosphosulfate (PAPS) [Sinorhizobium fredii HH103]